MMIVAGLFGMALLSGAATLLAIRVAEGRFAKAVRPR